MLFILTNKILCKYWSLIMKRSQWVRKTFCILNVLIKNFRYKLFWIGQRATFYQNDMSTFEPHISSLTGVGHLKRWNSNFFCIVICQTALAKLNVLNGRYLCLKNAFLEKLVEEMESMMAEVLTISVKLFLCQHYVPISLSTSFFVNTSETFASIVCYILVFSSESNIPIPRDISNKISYATESSKSFKKLNERS